jgi:hypothetical protein
MQLNLQVENHNKSNLHANIRLQLQTEFCCKKNEKITDFWNLATAAMSQAK